MKHLLLTTIAAVVLVGCGESPKPPDFSIHIAAEAGYIEAVKQHIAAGTDVNAKDSRGWTPLHYASNSGHKEIAELLIAEGADVNAKDDRGGTPLDVAIKYKQTETADLLRIHGGKTVKPSISIHKASEDGNIEVVKQHIAAGADVNAKSGPFRETPLHNAASGGHRETVELLIAAGADVSAKGLVFYGERTPLHRAAGQGHKGITELLIVEGADLNAKDEWEYTPLHYAAGEGHKEIVELLIAKGADVNAKSNVRGVNNNETPLDMAIINKQAETADLIRKHGGKTREELKAEGK